MAIFFAKCALRHHKMTLLCYVFHNITILFLYSILVVNLLFEVAANFPLGSIGDELEWPWLFHL